MAAERTAVRSQAWSALNFLHLIIQMGFWRLFLTAWLVPTKKMT